MPRRVIIAPERRLSDEAVKRIRNRVRYKTAERNGQRSGAARRRPKARRRRSFLLSGINLAQIEKAQFFAARVDRTPRTRHVELVKALERDLATAAPARLNYMLGIHENSTYAEAIARVMICEASCGDVKAATWVRDTIEARPVFQTNILIGGDRIETVIAAARQNPLQRLPEFIDA
jgi:hypothetical protein